MSLASPFLGLLFFASEFALGRWRRSSGAGGREMDRGSLSMLWRVIGVAITAAVLVSALRIGPRLPGGVPWGWAGVAVWVVGAALRWWAIRHLGRFFTVDVAVADGHRVVDDGPYRFVRHPSYTGLLLEFAGLGLALDNPLSLTLMIFPTLLALLHRIRIEETVLRTNLGEPYAAYMRRTKRLIPLVY